MNKPMKEWKWVLNEGNDKTELDPIAIDKDPAWPCFVDCDVVLISEDGLVCFFDQPPEAEEAKLIASTPKLYNALRKALKWMEETKLAMEENGNFIRLPSTYKILCQDIDEAKKALK
jgi:hypothetical protein